VQAIADLGAGQLAQVAVDVLDQVGEVLAAHLRQRDRGALLGQLVVPGVAVVALLLLTLEHRLEILVQLGRGEQLPDLALD
jgi:hypothetical protein